jgi:hypothetical protein
MKTITLLAVLAMLLLQLSGPKSSVGGPLTMMLILFVAMLAVGIHEAWLNKRGALGWIVSIVASVIGGLVAVIFVGMAMEMILPHLDLEGSVASSQHPLAYVLNAAMAILTVIMDHATDRQPVPMNSSATALLDFQYPLLFTSRY